MIRRTPWLVALFLVVAVAFAGCSGSDAAKPHAAPPRSPTTAPAPPPPPKPGACYNLSFAAATAPSTASSPVPCARRHSAETIFVGRTDPVEDGHLVAVDSARVARQIARTCPRKLHRHLGGDTETRRLSRFQTVWFAPTLRQFDRGAVWYRCDLVALAGRDHLLALPRHTKGILDENGVLDRFGTCGTASPTRKSFVRVACSRPHAWRAASTVDLLPHAKYLGSKAGKAADSACHDVAAAAADNALKFAWTFEWPNRDLWKAGQRWGWCWVPDPS